MLGTVVNAAAILIGGGVGLLLKGGLPSRFSEQVMRALSLCVLDIGVTGIFEGGQTLRLILSMVIGTLIGEGLDLDAKVGRISSWVERKFHRPNQHVSLAEGFLTASLLFCVGAMSIVGALEDGLKGDASILYTKSMLDGISALIFSSSLGAGVVLASLFVFIYQGSLSLLAGVISPFLTEGVISEMTCVGSLIIIGLALNMLKITDLKLMNFVPSIFMPILLAIIN